MDDSNKKQFWLMINVAMELTNHPPLTKEAIITWWHKLSKFEYSVVESALDEWVNSSNKAPTPNDILTLCKPKPTIFARLPSPLALAENHRHAVEVKEAVEKMTQGNRDMKNWARKIVANPRSYPDISYKLAIEALNG